MIQDPDYARAYTKARIVAWQYGWALTLHGSFTRDLDLVMIPWTDRACPAEGVVRRIADVTGTKIDRPPGDKPHGRKVWTLHFPEFGDPRWIDISVMLTLLATEPACTGDASTCEKSLCMQTNRCSYPARAALSPSTDGGGTTAEGESPGPVYTDGTGQTDLAPGANH